jgi:uncharacterized protein
MSATELSGSFRGKQDVIDKLLRPLRARLKGPVAFAIDRLIAEEDVVVMQARGRATSANGQPYDNTYCIVARIADGKLVEMTDYVDTELITAALPA